MKLLTYSTSGYDFVLDLQKENCGITRDLCINVVTMLDFTGTERVSTKVDALKVFVHSVSWHCFLSQAQTDLCYQSNKPHP